MQPIDHLKTILENVDGLRGKVYLYQYDSPQSLTPPAVVLNYAGLDDVTSLGGRLRIAMSLSVQLYVSLGQRADISKLLLDSIKGCCADGRVINVSGGQSGATGSEARNAGALRNMVLAEFLVTIRV